MALYIILSFFLIFISPNIRAKTPFDNAKQRNKGTYKNLSQILLFFSIAFIWMYGLRNSGGADDEVYRLIYEKNYGGKEPLFTFIDYLGKQFNFNYKFIFISYAIFDVVFLLLAFRNYYENNEQSLILYIAAFLFLAFPTVLTIMRQTSAMVVLFYLYSLDKPSWGKKVFFWILIICCHYGFIILIPIELYASSINYKFNKIILLSVPTLCLIIGGRVQLLSGIIRKVTNILGLYDYMNDEENYKFSSEIGIVAVSIFIVYITFVILRKKHVVDKTEILINKILFGNMFYLSAIFLTRNIRFGNRIGMYYTLFIPMLIQIIFDNIKLNFSKTLLRQIILIIFYFLFIVYMNDYFGNIGYVWSLKFW